MAGKEEGFELINELGDRCGWSILWIQKSEIENIPAR